MLCDASYRKDLRQSNSWRQVTGPGRGRMGRHCLISLRDDDVLEMDGGDGRTTVWMYLKPLNCALKHG